MTQQHAAKPELRIVRSYERRPETVRPFRIYENKTEKEIPHRCYKEERRALDQALVLAKWDLQTGDSYDVFNAMTGAWIATYKRLINGIEIMARKKSNG